MILNFNTIMIKEIVS